MRNPWAVFLLLLAMAGRPAHPQGDGQGADEATAQALADFKKAFASDSPAARIDALKQLAFVRADKSIPILAKILTGEASAVRAAAAETLGGMDDRASAKALGDALAPNLGRNEVEAAIVKSLQNLDYEVGAEAMNALLAQVADKNVVDILDVVLPALGKLGSPGSIEPLIQLMDHIEGLARIHSSGRDKRAAEIIPLKSAVKKALEAITGWKEKDHSDWASRWRDEGPQLMAGRVAVYQCKNGGGKWEQPVGEKPKCPIDDKAPGCVALVKTKLH